MYILGISAFYHDSAAALLKDGVPVAAAQEERFSRIKHDFDFPIKAIKFCLERESLKIQDIEKIVFYDKPLLKFERLIETYLSYAPRGIKSFIQAMPIWMQEKMFLKSKIINELAEYAKCKKSEIPQLLFTEHHQAHAASAFFPSPFEQASVLCLDGVGEWATTTVWNGNNSKLELEWEIDFPHSLGLLYSAFTYYIGFKVNSGEYKLMGLAPYGEAKYVKTILNNLIDLKEDGTFRLDMSYFNYASGLTMTSTKFHKLFGGPPRSEENTITKKDMDIARSIQEVTEEILLRLTRTIHAEYKNENLCLAGGVALNCVANGRLLREGPFKNIWAQPAAGDAGGALGAALATWHQFLGKDKIKRDNLQGNYLGPQFSNDFIQNYLEQNEIPHQKLDDSELFSRTAKILDSGLIVAWLQGRMEFGPRALGARSILADPRNSEMQKKLNLKIKFRESFRPFAPAVLAEDVEKYFDYQGESPYMLQVAQVKSTSNLPAITHVDTSARLQTVSLENNPRFHRLLQAFKGICGISVLVNTSFNVRDEPIVCSPLDAYHCFMKTNIDYLVLENFIIDKREQSKLNDNKDFKIKKSIENVETLRHFGFLLTFMIPLSFGLIIPWVWSKPYPGLPYGIGGIFLLWTLTVPKTLNLIYTPWMKVAAILGWINARIILGAIFYSLFTPLALFFRLTGRDILKQKFDDKNSSYRHNNQEDTKSYNRIKRMEHPF